MSSSVLVVVSSPVMAFLGQDGWKSGLTSEALRKVEELEAKADRLERDRGQKQMRLETVEQALEKQKQKVRLLETNMLGSKFVATVMEKMRNSRRDF